MKKTKTNCQYILVDLQKVRKFRPRYFLIYIQILCLSVFCLVSTCMVEVSNITSPNGALLIIKQEYPLTADKKCHKKMKFLSRETKLSPAI